MNSHSNTEPTLASRLAFWLVNAFAFWLAELVTAITPGDAEPFAVLGAALGASLLLALAAGLAWQVARRLPIVSRLSDPLVAFGPGALLLAAKLPVAFGGETATAALWLGFTALAALVLGWLARGGTRGLWIYGSVCLAIWLPSMRLKDLARVAETHNWQVVLGSGMAILLSFLAFDWAFLSLAGKRFGVSSRIAFTSGIVPVVGVFLWRLLTPPPFAFDAEPAQERLGRGTPLILIVLDTTRADHLSLYGYPRSTSPQLERFARDAVVYEQVVSTSSWTLPAHASLFTGLFPLTHGALRLPGLAEEMDDLASQGIHRPSYPLPDDTPTLAEHLQQQGFSTAGIVANFAYLDPVFGVGRGFETYFSTRNTPVEPMLLRLVDRRFLPLPWARAHWQVYRSADQINRLAVRWLEAQETNRFFLFLNYMEPHLPWGPHQPGLRYDEFAAEATLPDRPDGTPTPDASLKQRIDLYDSNVASLDQRLGELFDRLRAMELYDRSLIVVTADHGESFGENGANGHGKSLNEAEVRVPLLIKYPGSRETGRRGGRIQLIDLLPTLTRELGRPFAGHVEGHDVGEPPPSDVADLPEAGESVPELVSESVPESVPESVADPTGAVWLRLAEMYGDPTDTTGAYQGYTVALWDGERKLIVRDDGELFYSERATGLETPIELPEELTAWAEEQRAELLERKRLLEQRARARQEALELDPEVQKGLEALGYV